MSITINGSGAVTGVSAGALEAAAGPVLATAQASTSGTSIDFTGIPSWVKRITVMFSGVSTNLGSANNILVQIGSGSFETSGYQGAGGYSGSSTAMTNPTNGFNIYSDNAADLMHGELTITLIGSNAWVCSGVLGWSTRPYQLLVTGSKSLAGSLDRLRITTANGTASFDAGTINIMYE